MEALKTQERKVKRWRAPKGKILLLRERQALKLVVCTPPSHPTEEGRHRCQSLVNAGAPFLEWQPWLDKSTGPRGDLVFQLGVNDPSFTIDDYDALWVQFVDGEIAEQVHEWGIGAAADPDRVVCLVGIRTRDRERVRKALTKFRAEKLSRHARERSDRPLSQLSPTWQAFCHRLNARERKVELDKVSTGFAP